MYPLYPPLNQGSSKVFIISGKVGDLFVSVLRLTLLVSTWIVLFPLLDPLQSRVDPIHLWSDAHGTPCSFQALAEAEKLGCSYHAVSNVNGEGVPEAAPCAIHPGYVGNVYQKHRKCQAWLQFKWYGCYWWWIYFSIFAILSMFQPYVTCFNPIFPSVGDSSTAGSSLFPEPSRPFTIGWINTWSRCTERELRVNARDESLGP